MIEGFEGATAIACESGCSPAAFFVKVDPPSIDFLNALCTLSSSPPPPTKALLGFVGSAAIGMSYQHWPAQKPCDEAVGVDQVMPPSVDLRTPPVVPPAPSSSVAA